MKVDECNKGFSHIPEIKSSKTPLDGKDIHIIVASDGLGDHCTPDEISEIIKKAENKSPANLAVELGKAVADAWHFKKDNVSIIMFPVTALKKGDVVCLQVFDGHGGPSVANNVANHFTYFLQRVINDLRQGLSPPSILAKYGDPGFLKTPDYVVDPNKESNDTQIVPIPGSMRDLLTQVLQKLKKHDYVTNWGAMTIDKKEYSKNAAKFVSKIEELLKKDATNKNVNTEMAQLIVKMQSELDLKRDATSWNCLMGFFFGKKGTRESTTGKLYGEISDMLQPLAKRLAPPESAKELKKNNR